LHGSGVRVTTVKPGFVATKMLGDKKPGFGVIAPERAARTIAGNITR
jgi:NAD(P)-dependent dehydrogenase (short-subunit alcohol dehydrogenase family)